MHGFTDDIRLTEPVLVYILTYLLERARFMLPSVNLPDVAKATLVKRLPIDSGGILLPQDDVRAALAREQPLDPSAGALAESSSAAASDNRREDVDMKTLALQEDDSIAQQSVQQAN